MDLQIRTATRLLERTVVSMLENGLTYRDVSDLLREKSLQLARLAERPRADD